MVLLNAIAGLGLLAVAAAQVSSRRLGVTRFAWEQSALNQPVKRSEAASSFQLHNFSVPVDHFKQSSKYAPHSDDFFNMQYYFDASHYKPGGPVIVLSTGEASAVERLPFIETGILYQLAKATNGISVVLEHRYYGNSFPVPDLSVKNMRFLDTEQAMADAAYFAQHIRFPGVDQDVTSAHTPWFAYGGSYAGAFVAFLRTKYPDVYWGAISASGVTAAVLEYWQYYSAIINFGPQQCIKTVQKLTDMMDNIFERNQKYTHPLRELFGLDNLTSNADFNNIASLPLAYWQSRNWDPAVSDETFLTWCGNLTADHTIWPAFYNQTERAQQLLRAGGYGDQTKQLTVPLLNWMGYVSNTIASTCEPKPGNYQDECFALNYPDNWKGTATTDWETRSWTWQVCNEYGYFTPGNRQPKGKLGLVSRQQDLAYLSKQCDLAFGIKTQPDVSKINNAYGSYELKYPRVTFVGGEADPWRDATPLAEWRWPQGKTGLGKTSSGQKGYLIHTDNYGAVHHWDENGVLPEKYTKDFPPAQVQEAQAREAKLVNRWIAEWKACKLGGGRRPKHC